MVNLTTTTLLFTEIICFGCTFGIGMILIVVKNYYYIAIFGMTLNFLFLTFCSINERIKEMIDEVNAAIYDLPWYQLPPKDRRLVLLAMQCNRMNIRFTAAQFHEATFERFITVIREACSNVIILSNLAVRQME